MKEFFLLKEGELTLKGLNRSTFEDRLVKNLKHILKELGEFKYHKSQSTITVEPTCDCDMDEVSERIGALIGVATFSRAAVCEKDFDTIVSLTKTYVASELEKAKTFKVKAKRSDKRFPLNSPQICMKMGEVLLNEFPHLSVDVHSPEVEVTIEVRDTYAYIYAKKEKGAGGIPVGMGGEGMLLISGGIDSPVAGYMMAKRGLRQHAIHFASPPYTGEKALEKVKTLLSIVARYNGGIPFHLVPFTKIQEKIKENCPEELFTIIMRRMMMRVAQRVCQKQNENGRRNIQALVTGESLGQVASQTLGAMICTDAVCEMPVLRPQIGLDKSEIVETARKIGTFETSILPYEDCCTVFTPKHPKTKPQLEIVEKAEQNFDFEPLIQEAVDNIEFSIIHADWLV